MQHEDQNSFDWSALGDLRQGRPTLGLTMRVDIYRLMQFALRDVLEQRYGTVKTDLILYEAGALAGQAFYAQFLSDVTDLEDFLARLQTTLRELGIGLLTVEEADIEAGRFILTLSEDLDCSGLPETHDTMCHYDEGFIAAILESYGGAPFKVKEIDCWCTGARTCRFAAEIMN